MFQIEKISGFVSGFELSVLYSYPMRSAFVFVSGLKCGKMWHPNPISSVSDPNPSLHLATPTCEYYYNLYDFGQALQIITQRRGASFQSTCHYSSRSRWEHACDTIKVYWRLFNTWSSHKKMMKLSTLLSFSSFDPQH